MSSYLSDFEHTKLDAHVYPGVVVETHYISDPASGQRRTPQTKVWKFEQVLGRGGSGEVRLEFNADGDERRAVKRIWGNGTTLRREYEMELKALLEFSKPKYKQAAVFVEFHGWFEDHDSVYLAMEHIPLGDLEHNIPARPGAISEPEIKDIVYQILEGLKIMHLENFAHRDLKPQNILVCRGSPAWWIKLTDFGVSKKHTEDTELRTQTGTRPYMAPEVLNYISGVDSEVSGYTKAVDMWALGCIIHRIASGVVPFPPGPSLGNFCNNPSIFAFHTMQLCTQGVSLMRDLLQPQPSIRLDVLQALAHPWILNMNKETATQSPQCELDPTTHQSPWNTATHAGLQSLSSTSDLHELSDTTLKQPNSGHASNITSEFEDTSSSLYRSFRRRTDESNSDISLDGPQQHAQRQPPRYPFGSKDYAPAEHWDILKNITGAAQKIPKSQGVNQVPSLGGSQTSITKWEQIIKKPLDPAFCLKELTKYSVFTIREVKPNDGGEAPWARVDVVEKLYSRNVFVSNKIYLISSGPSLAERLARLTENQRNQISTLMDRLQDREVDYATKTFEWKLVQIEYNLIREFHKNGYPLNQRTESITVYTKRAPRDDVDPIRLYQSIKQSKPDKPNQVTSSGSTLESG